MAANTLEELKEQVGQLSYEMLLNENNKLSLENDYELSLRICSQLLLYGRKQEFERKLLQKDQLGFELSLEYNELLFENGMRHNTFGNGPDATNVWAENYLYKYNLKYPLGWDVQYIDRTGQHYSYRSQKRIEEDYQSFINQINNLKVSDIERKRLFGIADYYKRHRQLVSNYFGNTKDTKLEK